MFPVKLRGTCPLKVQQLKIGGGGDVPPRLPGAPMIKPPPRFQRLTSPMSRLKISDVNRLKNLNRLKMSFNEFNRLIIAINRLIAIKNFNRLID